MVSENSQSIERVLDDYEHQAQIYWEFMTAEERCQWAYLAGIIDGEGSITISLQRRTGRPNDFQLRLAVKMMHEITIRSLKSIAGVGRARKDKYGSRTLGKDVWEWVAVDRNAASVIRHCMLFLITKREQARVALAFHELQAYPRRRAHPLSPSNREKRKLFYTEMGKLNKKGPGKRKVIEEDGNGIRT